MVFANSKIVAKENITMLNARTYQAVSKLKLVTKDIQNIAKDLRLVDADSKMSVPTITNMFLEQKVNVNSQKR